MFRIFKPKREKERERERNLTFQANKQTLAGPVGLSLTFHCPTDCKHYKTLVSHAHDLIEILAPSISYHAP